jgi:hypothetical protein
MVLGHAAYKICRAYPNEPLLVAGWQPILLQSADEWFYPNIDSRHLQRIDFWNARAGR